MTENIKHIMGAEYYYSYDDTIILKEIIDAVCNHSEETVQLFLLDKNTREGKILLRNIQQRREDKATLSHFENKQ